MFGCVSRETGCVSREPHLVPQSAAVVQKNDMLSRDEIAAMMQECMAKELRPMQQEISSLRDDIANDKYAAGRDCQVVFQAVTEMRKQYEQHHIEDGEATKDLCADVKHLAKLMSEPKLRVEAAEKKIEAVQPLALSDLKATCIGISVQESGVRPNNLAAPTHLEQEANFLGNKSSGNQTPLAKVLGEQIPEPEKEGSFYADNLAMVLQSSLREVLPDLMAQFFSEQVERLFPVKPADVEERESTSSRSISCKERLRGRASPAKPAGDIEERIPADDRPSNVAAKVPDDDDDMEDDIVQQQISEIVNEQLQHDKSILELLAERMGIDSWVAKSRPTGVLAHSTETRWFACMESFLIISHTLLVAYETDLKIKAVLMEPPGKVPEWFKTANIIFSIAFSVELAYRIAVLRSWFFVSPFEKGWNWFDFIVVGGSLIAESLSGPSFKFMRTLRLFRMVRILSVIKYFRELRRILNAILACFGTMLWSYIFLGLVTFMASLVLLQGLADGAREMEVGSTERGKLVEGAKLWWSSLAATMINLVAAVAGAGDWLEMKAPLDEVGLIYSYGFVLYQCFLLVGILNVLTGVFLESTQENKDESMIVQGEQIKEEMFSRQMLAIFKQMDAKGDGVIDGHRFRKAVKLPEIKAALASYHILPKHSHVLFDALDTSKTGIVNASEFVSGMMDLKGEANAMDVRRILSAIRDSTYIKDEAMWSTD